MKTLKKINVLFREKTTKQRKNNKKSKKYEKNTKNRNMSMVSIVRTAGNCEVLALAQDLPLTLH